MFWVFWLQGMWDLSSLNRDRTGTPCIGKPSLNHWTAREVPGVSFNVVFYSYHLERNNTLLKIISQKTKNSDRTQNTYR